MSRAETAQKLAKLFAIFPLQAGAKVPLKGSQGFKDATQDAGILRQTWEDDDHNIGVYPWGSETKHVIFDFEGEGKGYDVQKTLKLWQRKTGCELDLTDNFVVETPSGGLHVYMAVPEGDDRVYTSSVKFVDGCDVRAHGGYVVGPGSIADGKPYKVRCAIKPKPLPEGAAAALHAKRETVVSSIDAQELDLDHNVKRAVAFLQQTEPAIEGQGGDDWTNKTIWKVRGFGISKDRCLDLLYRHWDPRCVPPWGDELGGKVENAYKNERDDTEIVTDPNEAFAGMIEREIIEEIPRGPSRFRLITRSEIKSWPAPTWTVKRLIPECGLGFVIGRWGAYKTYITVDLCASIATGKDFAGHPVTKPGAVIYLAGEGPYGVRLRFEAWFKKMGMEWPDNLYLVECMPNFGNADEVKELIAEASAAGPVVVVVDTISMASLGADENSAKDMGMVLQGLKHIRETLDCFVLGVHHLGKDESRGSRGWSGLPAAADVEIQIRGDAQHKRAMVRLSKLRDGEIWTEWKVFSATEVDLWPDEDGEMLTNIAFRYNPNEKPREVEDDDTKLGMKYWPEIKALCRSNPDKHWPNGDMATHLMKAVVVEEEGEDEEMYETKRKNILAWLGRQIKDKKGEAVRWSKTYGTERKPEYFWKCPPDDAPEPVDNTPIDDPMDDDPLAGIY